MRSLLHLKFFKDGFDLHIQTVNDSLGSTVFTYGYATTVFSYQQPLQEGYDFFRHIGGILTEKHPKRTQGGENIEVTGRCRIIGLDDIDITAAGTGEGLPFKGQLFNLRLNVRDTGISRTFTNSVLRGIMG